ncbi:MAG: acylphosphatase [Deltaproteobacteria bacterium]|nr:acylphosphatase [Deltaproteobacteria bacterium]
MEEKVRAHVVIHGRVQGVFFRMETRKTALRHEVDGWVRNNPDGTVEAVFEGDKPRVEAVLSWCGHGPPHARVDELKLEWEPYTGKYSTFDIRY